MSFHENVLKDIQDLQDKGYIFNSDWFHYGIKTDIFNNIKLNIYNKIDILEIGAFEGKSSVWFIDTYLNHPDSSITIIDPYLETDTTTNVESGTFNIFKHNIKNTKLLDKVIFHKEKSKDILVNLNRINPKNDYSCYDIYTSQEKILPYSKLKSSFDIIFIDGSHLKKDIIVDIVLTWDLLKKDGYMILDDYQSEGQDVKSCINFFLSCIDSNEYTILHDRYQLILKKLV
jgi:predicted O-methyltransferase YrrM